jgi:hypothetical protein
MITGSLEGFDGDDSQGTEPAGPSAESGQAHIGGAGEGAVENPSISSAVCNVQTGESPLPLAEEPRCVKKVRHFNRFVDEALAGLPPSAAVLWFTLFRFARDGYATVSQRRLAVQMGVEVGTVKKNLRVLYDRKLVKVTKAAIKGKRVNTYRLGILELSPRARTNRRARCSRKGDGA